MKTIRIATDYSDTPLGRYPSDNEYNGERFRDEFLKPALVNHDKVVVDIDGLEGCGSSFLEEAFGGLVRKRYFTAADLWNKLTIKGEEPNSKTYRELIWRHIQDAKPEKG